MFETATYALFTCSLAVAGNWLRRDRVGLIELTPNCLLTRYPVVFVTGQRSLFYFRHYWNILPQFLVEHGYEVHVLELPWASSRERADMCLRTLNSQPNAKFHFIGDRSSLPLLEMLAEQARPWLASLTLLTAEEIAFSQQWRLRQLRNEITPIQQCLIKPLPSPHPSWVSRIGVGCLKLHNWFCRLRRKSTVHPMEVGLVSETDLQGYARQVLRHCISLAEDDAR